MYNSYCLKFIVDFLYPNNRHCESKFYVVKPACSRRLEDWSCLPGIAQFILHCPNWKVTFLLKLWVFCLWISCNVTMQKIYWWYISIDQFRCSLPVACCSTNFHLWLKKNCLQLRAPFLQIVIFLKVLFLEWAQKLYVA